jgi:Flp pilus assembly protein TadB
MLILPVVASLLQDQQVISRSIEIKEDEQLAYPEFLNRVLALLQSGLSLHKTLEICSQNRQEHIGISLNRLLKDLARKMVLGMPAGHASSGLSSECSIPQIQSALTLIYYLFC